MKPGRELDALVAEKVVGWKKLHRKDYPQSGDWHGLDWMWDYREGALYWEAQNAPTFSTSISAAWDVVEMLQAKGWYCILDNMKDFLGNWQCHFERGGLAFSEEASTAPHAICLAALAAIGVD